MQIGLFYFKGDGIGTVSGLKQDGGFCWGTGLCSSWKGLILKSTQQIFTKKKNQHLSHEVFSTRETESSGLKRQLSLKKYSDNINVNCGTIQLPIYYFRLMQQ